VPLDAAIPAGPWDAHLSLRSGLSERAVRARITFPSAAGVSAAPVRAVPDRRRQILIPITGGMSSAVALWLILLLLLKRRRGDSREAPARGRA
jgi:hypothetical protein